jgi:ferredoxin
VARTVFPWLKSSTRRFLQEARATPGYSWFDLLHGYVYARWPYLYIGIGTGEHPLARWLRPMIGWLGKVFGRPPDEHAPGFADTYHGKVVPLESARQLVAVQEDVSLPNLESIVPYAMARDIVLKNPGHIVALECPCRASRANPCLPLDVCLIIGEPFASMVAEHHPRRSRWLTRQQAESILEAEHARGHVHHAFFKDAMLGRFYAICNCCPCCCGAMQAMRNGTPMLASSGYVCQVDESACTGCGECQTVCPFEAITAEDGVAVVDRSACMGCGVCISSCASTALGLVRAPEKGEPLEILTLIAQASDLAGVATMGDRQ